MKNYGKILKTERKAHKITQMELAKAINVHQTTLSQWELNKTIPTIDNLERLADFYGISIDELIEHETKKNA